jgi:Na+-transporting NADH:ubiquinone oxidoreductase subunit C
VKNKAFFAIIYMFVVTAFFSFLLIGFARATERRVRSNEQLAFEKAVIEVFQLDENLSQREIHNTFEKLISKPDEHSAGAYLYKENDLTTGYAVPVEGKGFWAPIKGIIGLEADRETITGIAFYQQNETPGLGAEITKDKFRNQFVGRKLEQSDKPFGIKPFGSQLKENQVHAVTGATQTCTRLEKLINEDINNWRVKMTERTD